MQSEQEYNYKISEIGNYLAQWPSLDFASKKTLQNIAKFVLSEKAKSKAEGVIEAAEILKREFCKKIQMDEVIIINECDKLISKQQAEKEMGEK